MEYDVADVKSVSDGKDVENSLVFMPKKRMFNYLLAGTQSDRALNIASIAALNTVWGMSGKPRPS